MPRAKFSGLRQILQDLGFTMRATPRFVRFDMEGTDMWFLYPPYAETDDVSAGDLVAARHILDMRGLMTRERFEELLRQSLIAG